VFLNFKLTLVNDRGILTLMTVIINEEQFQKLFSSYNVKTILTGLT